MPNLNDSSLDNDDGKHRAAVYPQDHSSKSGTSKPYVVLSAAIQLDYSNDLEEIGMRDGRFKTFANSIQFAMFWMTRSLLRFLGFYQECEINNPNMCM
jgi:hypothetical protein